MFGNSREEDEVNDGLFLMRLTQLMLPERLLLITRDLWNKNVFPTRVQRLFAWSCYEACEVVQLSSSGRENEKKKKILKRKKHINFLSSPLPHSYAYGVLNGLMCGFHPLIKPPTDGFLPLCSLHLLGWFWKCVGSQGTGGLRENVGSDSCVRACECVSVCVCVPVCWQPLCFSLSFIFLHWGERVLPLSPPPLF